MAVHQESDSRVELQPVPGRLAHQVALVTGGAQGIGDAIVNRLVSEGATVALLDLAGPSLEAARARWRNRPSILVHEGDVTDPAALALAVDHVCARFGRLDVLINNAGIAPVKAFLDTDAELFDRIMAVNVRGSYFAAQAAARVMRAQGGGCIVQIASTCAFSAGASKNLSAYNVSKAGVRQLVASLAGELADDRIRVNAVAPGTIDTAMTRACLPDEASFASWADRIPLGSIGLPSDIAAACAFLCSNDARYITGQTIVVDGGWLVR